MFDWNDLKYFLAITREGSTTAAAKVLGISQSTVQRRMAALERQLGCVLLVRHASGYKLTPLAQELVPLAQDIARSVEEFELRLNRTSPDGRDVIRLTCPEPVVGRLRLLIERFHARHPKFKVEFLTSDRYLDLVNGDADVAFRSGDTDDALVGHEVAESVWAVYANSTYVRTRGSPATLSELNQHSLLGLDESMSQHRLMLWLRTVAPQTKIESRSNSVLGLLQMVTSGIGIAPLPVPIAEDAGLVRVLGPIRELSRSWRLLTHPRLRDTPQVAAFFDFVTAERDAVKTIFSGR